MRSLSLLAFLIIFLTDCRAQSIQVLSANSNEWEVVKRNASFDEEVVHMDAKEGEGFVLHKDTQFQNGTIEFDVKGENKPGSSFVGIAFHFLDEKTFDVVYFRPFNFKNPDRNSHSVQYTSMPDYGWRVLRSSFPGKYENEISPVPEPVDDWFHVKVVVNHPMVKVYVNGSSEATLEVEQKSDQKRGQLGFWVGHNSEGWFKNLSVSESK